MQLWPSFDLELTFALFAYCMAVVGFCGNHGSRRCLTQRLPGCWQDTATSHAGTSWQGASRLSGRQTSSGQTLEVHSTGILGPDDISQPMGTAKVIGAPGHLGCNKKNKLEAFKVFCGWKHTGGETTQRKANWEQMRVIASILQDG